MKVLKFGWAVRTTILLLWVAISGGVAIGQTQINEKDIEAVLDSASIYVHGYQHQKGDSLLQLVSARLQSGTPKEHLARFHLLQGHLRLNLWQLAEAKDQFLTAIALYSTLQDSAKLVNAYTSLGNTLTEQNYYLEGALYQRKALTYFVDDDSTTYFSIMSNLAVTYSRASEFEKSLKQYIHVKDYFEREGLYSKVAVVVNNIGELYREGFGNFAEAINHYHRARRLNIQTGQDNYLVQNYHNLSLAHESLEQYDSAYHYLRKSYVLRKRISGEGGLAITLYAFGQLYVKTNKPDSAEWAFNETLRISENLGIAPGLYFGHMGLGELYEMRNQQEKAYSEYKKALEAATEIGALSYLENARNHMYMFYKANKRYAQALAEYEKLNIIRDSIANLQSDNRLAEVKTRYEMDRAEAENEMLKAQQEAQLLEIERQYWVLIGLSVVLVLIVVAAVLLAWVNRQRKRAFDQAETSRKELELQYQKVKEQEEKLEEANALKNRIFSVLGHDLRSPLINISSMLHLISAKEITSSELENLLGHLQTETDLSIHTLHNILQWSRMQMNDQATNRTHISVRNVIRDLRQIFESTARLKSVTLHFNDDCKDELWVDENQFKSIATNLISNALKFTPKGSSVIVAFEADARDVCFSVSDRGNGFDPAMIRLFEEGEKPTSLLGTAGEKGTGIGLQIVRDFVAAHNGRITLMNNEHGGGYVEIRFPKMVQGQKEPSRGEVASV